MKKRVISLIMALVMLLGASVVAVNAAKPVEMTWGENKIPLSDDVLTVTESAPTFAVRWANPPAAGQLRVYVLNGDFEEQPEQVLEPVTLSYQKPFTYTIPSRYVTDKSADGEIFQVVVVAIDQNGKEFLACESGDIRLGDYPTLDPPAVSLSDEGVASWETDSDAASYILSLYYDEEEMDEEEPKLIATMTVENALDRDGRYQQELQADFSKYLTKAGIYFVTAYSTNPNYGWGDSYESISNSIDYGRSVGCSVSGTVTSFLSDSDPVKITLDADINNDYPYSRQITVQGKKADFTFGEVPAGTYSLTIEKANHVAWEERVEVDSDITGLDRKLQPRGDVTGDGAVTTLDFARANAHAKGVVLLSGYALQCGDVVGNDGKLTTLDAARINAHAKGAVTLW